MNTLPRSTEHLKGPRKREIDFYEIGDKTLMQMHEESMARLRKRMMPRLPR